jgi:hypothetical protein
MELDATAVGAQVGVIFETRFEMNEEPAEQQSDTIPMHIREIRLEDGRYMIFYTFGDEGDQEEDV